ncbi:type III toxin-antitoxin system TenpIN family toxin [Salinicoccus albus]|uniref:type III toxin-antitoxin system TenpIN family toxin n=1 Tax=Salinicoccus albus TaxID=418756 RepID=UPI00037CDA91|nr:hypothetical protein [Salinicoccus albus]
MGDNHSIILRQLTKRFYEENNLIEMLDAHFDKGRGYGVLLVKIIGYQFAILLRSNMHIGHKDGYTTRIHHKNGKSYRHGLDFSKAVIIKEQSYISSEPFMLDKKSDFVKIRKSEHHIITTFEKYVNRYTEAVREEDINILKSYRFSTLQNYHKELNILDRQ